MRTFLCHLVVGPYGIVYEARAQNTPLLLPSYDEIFVSLPSTHSTHYRRFDYKGYIKPRVRGGRAQDPMNTEQMIAINFTWRGVEKDASTIFIGTSPEFEIALYTMCVCGSVRESIHTYAEGERNTKSHDNASAQNKQTNKNLRNRPSLFLQFQIRCFLAGEGEKQIVQLGPVSCGFLISPPFSSPLIPQSHAHPKHTHIHI